MECTAVHSYVSRSSGAVVLCFNTIQLKPLTVHITLCRFILRIVKRLFLAAAKVRRINIIKNVLIQDTIKKRDIPAVDFQGRRSISTVHRTGNLPDMNLPMAVYLQRTSVPVVGALLSIPAIVEMASQGYVDLVSAGATVKVYTGMTVLVYVPHPVVVAVLAVVLHPYFASVEGFIVQTYTVQIIPLPVCIDSPVLPEHIQIQIVSACSLVQIPCLRPRTQERVRIYTG